MNQREKLLAGVIVLILGYFGIEWFVTKIIAGPLREKDELLASAEKQVQAKQAELMNCRAAQFDLERWKSRALPANISLAQTLYQDYLHRQLAAAGIERPTITPSSPSNARGKEAFVRLPYHVQAQCDLKQLTRFLYSFYQSGVLSQIHRVSLSPIVRDDRLKAFDVSLDIEAVSMHDAKSKDALPAPPTGTTPARTIEEYALISELNVFSPTKWTAKSAPIVAAPKSKPPAVDDRGNFYVRGTVIVDGIANLWLTNDKTKSRIVIPEGKELKIAGMEATVVKITSDQVVLRVDDKLGEVRLGGNLASWKQVEVVEATR